MDAPYQARNEEAVLVALDIFAAQYGRTTSQSEAKEKSRRLL
jgi:hypothetical protein